MDYAVWMRASLITITGGGGGVALSAENEIKGTRMHGWWVNRLQEKNEKRYGPAVYGVDFCW